MGFRKRSADALREEASRAAELRVLLTNPDVVALRVEEIRRAVDTLFGISVLLGLAFTAVSVQRFAAGDSSMSSLAWWAAWLMDPMFSLSLIAVLIAEVITARYRIKLGPWADVCKWVLLVSVLTMNVWEVAVAGVPSQVVLHAAPVALVFAVAQIAPIIREKLTESVLSAAEEAKRVVDQQSEVVAEQATAVYEARKPEPIAPSQRPVFAPQAPVDIPSQRIDEPESVVPAAEPAPAEELVVDQPPADESLMTPAEYLINAWKFGRRVDAPELYTRYPDKKKETLRSVMSQTRKRNPGLEPSARPEEEDGNGQRRRKTG